MGQGEGTRKARPFCPPKRQNKGERGRKKKTLSQKKKGEGKGPRLGPSPINSRGEGGEQ